MFKFKYLLSLSFIFLLSGCTTIQELKKDIALSLHSSKDGENKIKQSKIKKLYKRKFNYDQIGNLEDAKFNLENGKMGLWIPYKFIKEFGGGIYFLEKYSKEKIPILFIHGAGGNAVNWKYIINNIDRTIFQPLVVSYPSGAKLSITVEIIDEALQSLIKKYDMGSIYIVSHSMGGFVSKSLISKLDKKRVKGFITLSTPWKGFEGAKKSADLPYYIPSWVDMKPNSSFISSIKDKTILSNIDHYLMFGYKGKMTFYGRDNDGTISLESQLALYAQKQAVKVIGFNEDHISILQSKEVVKKINIILEDKF